MAAPKYQGSGQEAKDDATAVKAGAAAKAATDTQINRVPGGGSLGAYAAGRRRTPMPAATPTPTAPTPRPVANIMTPMDRWNGRG